MTTNAREAVCDCHGSYQATEITSRYFKSTWTHCPTCDQLMEAENQSERQRRMSDDQRERHRLVLEEANIPERYRDKTLDHFECAQPAQRMVLQWARDYLSHFDLALSNGRGAVLCGAPGTGKTHLAIGMLLHILSRGQRGYYSTVQRLILRMKDTFSKVATEKSGQAMAAFVDPDFAVFDEVGVQFGSKFEHDLLFEVLDERCAKLRPTVLVSNLDRSGVTAFLGERVMRRLREDGGDLLSFDWEPYQP